MRDIKFRVYGQLEGEGEYRMFYDTDLGGIVPLTGSCKKVICDHTLMQYTGLKDKNGVEIYEGDLLNIFFTSNDGEHIHDCVYSAFLGKLGIEFRFQSLLWTNAGHNQYSMETTLCTRYDSLDYGYFDDNNQDVLMVRESWGENELLRNRWKQNDKSMFFEKIGNIYQNPELLKPIN